MFHPIVTGPTYTAVLVIVVLAIAVLAYFDTNSTKTAINRGTGSEVNPWMAYLMKHFPRAWPYLHQAQIVVPAALFASYGPHGWVLLILGGAAITYFVIIMRNYDFSK